jgi:hypothetical protein
MSENDRFFNHKVTDLSIGVVVYIGSTNSKVSIVTSRRLPCSFDVNFDVIRRFEFGNGTLFDGYVLDLLQYESWIPFLFRHFVVQGLIENASVSCWKRICGEMGHDVTVSMQPKTSEDRRRRPNRVVASLERRPLDYGHERRLLLDRIS